MSGRIKAGEGTLIGNSGEFFVVAELLKRGVVAALAPRNAPAFDILATHGKKTVRIRVKTKTGGYTIWRWNAKKDGSLFLYLDKKGDFTILVNLTEKSAEMDYYIVPTAVINDWLVSDFNEWVAMPGKNGRPHDPTNKIRAFDVEDWGKELAPYKNNWDLLWT